MHAAIAPKLFQCLGFPLLLIAVVMMPALALPLALILPLIVCPGRVSIGLWFSVGMSLIPCMGLALAGFPLPFCLSVLTFPFFSLLVSVMAQRRGLDISSSAFWYAVGMLLSFALLCQLVTRILGAGLFQGLTEYVMHAIQSHPQSNVWLFSLLSAGLLELPKNLEQAAGVLGQGIVAIPAVRTELLLALQFRLDAFLRQGLPALLTQLSIVIGLFTALNAARASIRKNLPPVVMVQTKTEGDPEYTRLLPSFRSLYLPLPYRRWIFGIGLLSLILLSVQSSEAVLIAGKMLFSVVTTLYCLLGAATWVFLLSRKFEGRGIAAGISAGVLFVFFPTVLMLLGVVDQVMHIRAAFFLSKKHEEE